MENESAHWRDDDLAEASSSRGLGLQATVEDDHDHDHDDAPDHELLAADPLDGDLTNRTPISFKRKTKAPPGFSFPRFLSSPLSLSRNQSPASRPISRANAVYENVGASDSTEAILPYLEGPGDPTGLPPDGVKDGSALDWYVEGPGRRVGYDNLTAIDWIYEYAKERQRLRMLHANTVGLMGHFRQAHDASQIWVVLILAGIASGLVAAFIDIAGDWLADIKTGYCSNQATGGRFYLSRGFCCFGYEELSQCKDWQLWSQAWGVGNKGGAYVINYMLFVAFSVLFATCASVLVRNFSVYAKHSGIPEIKTVLGGFVIRRFMGLWTLVTKSLGLCLAVASGLWLGKEGPLVHVACCCANLFLKLTPSINENEARKREALSAAAAAGISVAFASPIGGVLFSLEQLSYYFPDKTMWQSFVCAMVAAVTLQAFDPFRTGQLSIYQVTYHTGWHAFEIVPFALLGILGGMYGGLFVKLNMAVAEWRRRSKIFKNPVVEVAAVAFVTALVSFPVTFLRAQLAEVVHLLFAECVDIPDDLLGLCKSGRANTAVIALLVISALMGFFLASITFGLMIPAGIILPSMAVGALYGRAIGLFMEVLQGAFPTTFPFTYCEPDAICITPGTYAIVGAASALAGATRITVSIVVIMFELTGALTYVLPIMVAVMLSKWIGDGITKRGIYEAWIRFNGYPFLSNKDEDGSSAPDVPAAQVMTRIEDLIVITSTGHTIQSLQNILKAHAFRGFPVVDNPKDAILLGYISRTELAFALRTSLAVPRNLTTETEVYFSHQPLADPTTSLDLRPWMDHTPITLSANARLQLTVNMFQRLGLRYIIFVDRGSLKGLLTKKDVWTLIDGVEDSAREDASAAGVLRSQEGVEERGLLNGESIDDDDQREGLG